MRQFQIKRNLIVAIKKCNEANMKNLETIKKFEYRPIASRFCEKVLILFAKSGLQNCGWKKNILTSMQKLQFKVFSCII